MIKAQFLTFACLLFLTFTTLAQGTGPVKTKAGLVAGTTNRERDVAIYKGIPFAAPPVGELRWKAPQPVAPWAGVRECVAFGPSPMQNEPAPFSMWSEEFLIPKEPISEDCLYLNVWTGAKSPKEKRPVIVWIYGGGFNSGGSAVPIYDGEAMAKKGIVFVSINYRVGVFGFFAHPELTKESPHGASGNYGLQDQIAALQWVKENIAAFGGDPANVIIAGQSAGSMSVNALVASPLAKGLFQKAIAQSGASFSRGSVTLPEAEQQGVKLVQALGASFMEELRKAPAAVLQQKGQGMMYRPVVDGYVLPAQIADIFTSGKANKVALLTGWNEDEGLLFGPLKSAADFRKEAEQQYGTDAKTFLSYYPAADDAQAAASQLKLSRDMIFGVQNYTWANMQSQRGKPEVYVYRFTRKVPATGEYVKYGAFHTGEVPYAYNNLKFVNRPWEPTDHQLAQVMSSYWVNFARTGNPNGKGLPDWPAYTMQEKKIMDFGVKQEAKTLPDQAALDFIYDQHVKKQANP
ncbi:para-nitrobenzyl esterase [Pontibacter ummariensis]|uniref:Carboxylic ester hydrolase n=1 Tax=Pontibacter ummariensis TaxID=1610492 RepID=A0A239DAB3_9BACT|nr:carboxylesterase family protein [Pontibacter ummariensis]PRY14318.1 para-nitrobenzyl esterase [Pontibacter ummariensis]SNS29062.1 para-nitrobenzyl esterase [Pontibacter ummariensis]